MGTDVSLLAAFLAGILSFLSPCVLPLVPPYLGFLAGASIEEMAGHPAGSPARQRADRFLVASVAFAFVLGFSTVFVSLGATASAFGHLVARWSPTLAIVAGVVIIIMGLHFLGVFRVALFYREARFRPSGAAAGPVGAYVMGLAFAFGWTPCIGPVLAAILTIAGSRETVGDGALMLAVYSAGLGVPFMLAALFVGKFMTFLGRFRKQYRRVEQAMGGVLVLTGTLFLTGQFQQFSFWLLETFPALSRIG